MRQSSLIGAAQYLLIGDNVKAVQYLLTGGTVEAVLANRRYSCGNKCLGVTVEAAHD